MIGYISVGTNQLEKAIAFYEALLAPLNPQQSWDGEQGRAWDFGEGSTAFGVLTPYNKEKATVGNGSMVAFAVSSPALVDQLYAKAIALGAQDEGAPGERYPGFYAAYFRDLDGNKLNFYHHSPSHS